MLTALIKTMAALLSISPQILRGRGAKTCKGIILFGKEKQHHDLWVVLIAYQLSPVTVEKKIGSGS